MSDQFDHHFEQEQHAFCHSLYLSYVYKIKHMPMQSGYNSISDFKKRVADCQLLIKLWMTDCLTDEKIIS